MTCRYCGTTFAAKVQEWQDDTPMPTAHDVYPHLFVSVGVSAEKTQEIAEILQKSQNVDFGQSAQPQSQQPLADEPRIAAWAAGADIDEDVEITEQPRIALRRQGVEISATDEKADNYDAPIASREIPAQAETGHLREARPAEIPSPVEKVAEEVSIETEIISQASAVQDTVADCCDASDEEKSVEFPSFIKTTQTQNENKDVHEAIVEMASAPASLENENIVETVDVLPGPQLIAEEKIQPAVSLATVDLRVKKSNRRIFLWAFLIAAAIGILTGIIWIVFASGNADVAQAVSDPNVVIRNDVETKFDDSPKLDVAPVEESWAAETVAVAQPEKSMPAAAVVAVPSPLSVAPAKTTSKLSAEMAMPAELDSARVELTIVGDDGKILRLASRPYDKLRSGGEITFDVAEISGPKPGINAKSTVWPVDPIAMKILSMSRWGGIIDASAGMALPLGPVYVWCEFYGSDGVKTGAARGVLDRNSLSLRSGVSAVYRMLFQSQLSDSGAVPDEVLFETLSTGGATAMTASQSEVALVGMPVFFK